MLVCHRLCLLVLGLSTLACGRTEAVWWSDIYASDSGTDDDTDPTLSGDGDGDGDGDTQTSDPQPSTTGPTDSDTDTETETETDSDTATDTTGDTDTATDTTTGDTTTTSTDETETETTSDTSCDPVSPGLNPAPSRVLFLLDQGTHMGLDFDGLTRWEAIGDALFAIQDGLVWTYETEHQLGFMSFTSFNGNQGGECPVLAATPVAIDNGAAMQLEYAGQNPADDNPVAEAITAGTTVLDAMDEGGILVLLTGRNPDTCASQNPQAGVAAAIDAAEAAFAQGVRTEVFEIGNVNNGYAQNLANAGSGDAPGTTWNSPNDLDELRADLDTLLASLRSCTLELQQNLAPGGEQLCTLTLGDQVLDLEDPDGWTSTAPAQLELLGAACDTFLADGELPSLECECDALE